MDAIHGVTLDLLAEIMAKHTALHARLGERAMRPEFEQWLAAKGLDWNTFAHANNGWQERFHSDPTGRLEASFHTKMQPLLAKAHFGDVPDMSQDAKEGVTLEKYAQMMAELAAAGDGWQAVLDRHGLALEAWQRAQAAWNDAMSKDTTHRLTMQYGELYAKYTPGFQQQMEAQVAAQLAAANAARHEAVDEPQVEYTPETALAELSSPKSSVRYRGAKHLARYYELGDKGDPRVAEYLRRARPVLLEALDRHDDDQASDAEAAARALVDLEQFDDEVLSAIGRCLNRAREKLASLEAAFEPIRNQAVPERVYMQSKIQDFTSLVEELTTCESEVTDKIATRRDEERERAAMPSVDPRSAGASNRHASTSLAVADSPLDRILGILRALPVIGSLFARLASILR